MFHVPGLVVGEFCALGVDSMLMNARLQGRLGPLPDMSLPLEKIWCGSVLDRFHKHNPLHIAIETGDERWSYDELKRASGNLGRLIRGQRLKADSRWETSVIAIYARRNAALVVSLLGIMRACCAFVILDPSHPASRLAKCIELVCPVGLLNIGGQPLADEIRQALDAAEVSFTADVPESKEEFLPWHCCESETDPETHTIGPDDTLYVALTSGTTGTPRAIVGSHCPVSHFFEWQQRVFRLRAEDRVSMLSGLSHDPLLRDVLMPLWVGATICVPNQESFERPNALFQWMRRTRVSVAHLTPGIGHLLLAGTSSLEEQSLPDLRYAFFGGDVLRYKTVRRLSARAPKITIINCYGTTETPQVVAFHVVKPRAPYLDGDAESSEATIPLGKGIDNSQLIILDSEGRLCQPGQVGEICIRSPYLAKRILDGKDTGRMGLVSEESMPVIQEGLYRTGDLGYYLNDGSAMFQGRNDRQIKLRGYRIELGEIDRVLALEGSVLDHYVEIEGETDEDKRIVLYAVTGGGSVSRQKELRGLLAAKLPGFMVPDRIVLVPRLPLTPNGKIDRESLRAMGRKRPPTSVERRPESVSNIEDTLARIFRDSLLDQEIRLEDRIVDLGINSLQAVSLSCEIENAFKTRLSIGEIATQKDIHSLARDIFDRRIAISAGQLEPRDVSANPTDHMDSGVELSSATSLGEQFGPKLIPDKEDVFAGIKNRVLQLMARVAPDVWRTGLHRMRGVKIGVNVSIGYDSVIETSYPWLVRIGDRVNIGMRTTIIAHFRSMVSISKGQFTVDIRDGAFIGPGVIILPNVTIGEGAVVAAGSVVNHSVPPYTLVQGNPATPRARCGVALSGKTQYEEFIRKLVPIQEQA